MASAEVFIHGSTYRCVTPPAPRECFICGNLAEHECLQCLPDCKMQPGRIKQYCDVCNTQVSLTDPFTSQTSRSPNVRNSPAFLLFKVHSHPSRRGHRPRPLKVAEDAARDYPLPRHKMQLFAVLCIKTSHYVSFVKYGPNPHSWLFFDCMADRCGKISAAFFLTLRLQPFFLSVFHVLIKHISNVRASCGSFR